MDSPALSLGLSGEMPSLELLAKFSGIGLVRSEYLFRYLLLYPTEQRAQETVEQYLTTLCERTTNPVVYRTMEVTSAEANVLQGVERLDFESGDDLLGLRGVRRHIHYPSSLDAELKSVAVVSKRFSQLEIVAPFVTCAEEYVWFRKRVDSVVGGSISVGMMIETPAMAIDIEDALDAGCRNFIIGANDLTSLVAASRRSAALRKGEVPGLRRLLSHVVEKIHAADGRVDLAGYVTRNLLAFGANIGIDRVVVHYSDLPQLCNIPIAHLPDIGHLQMVKSHTRRAISELNK